MGERRRTTDDLSYFVITPVGRISYWDDRVLGAKPCDNGPQRYRAISIQTFYYNHFNELKHFQLIVRGTFYFPIHVRGLRRL